VTTIIDASALVAYLLEEDGFEKISEMVNEGVESVPLIIKESCNAALEARRNGRITSDESETVLQAILSLAEVNIKTVVQDKDLISAAFRIAEENRLTIYDSIYIALAQASGGRLASRDRRQLEVAEKLGIGIIRV
jgi:predicted nucleic acid-binding protein